MTQKIIFLAHIKIMTNRFVESIKSVMDRFISHHICACLGMSIIIKLFKKFSNKLLREITKGNY